MKKNNEVRMKENCANTMMKMLINDQLKSKNDIMHNMNNKKLNLNFRRSWGVKCMMGHKIDVQEDTALL